MRGMEPGKIKPYAHYWSQLKALRPDLCDFDNSLADDLPGVSSHLH
jgi:hypothetical protein